MSNKDEDSAAYRDEASLSEGEQSCTSTSSLSDCSSDEDEENCKKEDNKPQQKNVRTKGELGLEDLPKIEELNIKIPEEDMEEIGKVSAIVQQLVVVQSVKNSSPLYDDSVLFLTGGTPLGKVFEIFGPVIEPLYSVRFNSEEDIKDKGIKIGDEVYYAPSYKEYTSYVFVSKLTKEKGSDASWLHNNEPPVECLDYSDDEKEKAARHVLKARRRKIPQNRSSDTPERNGIGDAFANNDSRVQPVVRDVPLEKNYFREVYLRTPSSTPNSFWNSPSPQLHHSQRPNVAAATTSQMSPSSIHYRPPTVSNRPVFGAICKPPPRFTMPSHCIGVLPQPVSPFNQIPPLGIWAPPPATAFICMPPAESPGYGYPPQGSRQMNMSSHTTPPGYINHPQGSRHENMPPTSSVSYSGHPQQGPYRMNIPPSTPLSYNIYSQGSQPTSTPPPVTPLVYGSQPQSSQSMNIPPATPPSFSNYSQNSQPVSIPHTVAHSYSSPSQGTQHTNMPPATTLSSSQYSVSQGSQYVNMPPPSPSPPSYSSNQPPFQRRPSPFHTRNAQFVTRFGIPVSPPVVTPALVMSPAYNDSRWSSVPSPNRSGTNQQATNAVAQQQPIPPLWPRTNENHPHDVF